MQRQCIADGSAIIRTVGGADVRAKKGDEAACPRDRPRGLLCSPIICTAAGPMDGTACKLTRHKTLATPSLLALHAPQEARKWRGTNSGVLVTVSFWSRPVIMLQQEQPATRPACFEHASGSCCRRLPLAPLARSPGKHASGSPRTGNVHSGPGLCDPTTTPARRRQDNSQGRN